MKKKNEQTIERDIERWLNEGGRDLVDSRGEPRRDAKATPATQRRVARTASSPPQRNR